MNVDDFAKTLSLVPARHKAIVGDLAGTGQLIDCHEITPHLTVAGQTYTYCGVMDGIAIYKTAADLRELDLEASPVR